jgi:hypothetical protein
MDALERRYARWASDHGLVADESGHRFEGRMSMRDLVLTTGLGGSAPNPPDVVVSFEFAIDAPVLITRRDAASRLHVDMTAGVNEPERLLREVLGVSDQIRNVGLTPRFVRITFEPSVETDVFDAALEALEERLRLLSTGQGVVPYRG